MKPLAFFLIEWITDYINTPEIQQTPAMAVLYYTALLIWCAIAIIIVTLIRALINWIKGRDKK